MNDSAKSFDELVSTHDEALDAAFKKLPDPKTYRGVPYYQVPMRVEDWSIAERKPIAQLNPLRGSITFTFRLTEESTWVLHHRETVR